MKKLVLGGLLFIGLMIFVACGTEGIDGNGKVIIENRDITGFTGINVSEGISVEVEIGEKETVRVETDENLIEILRTEKKGDVLNVYLDKNVGKSFALKVYVMTKSIKELKASSAGRIAITNPIEGDQFKFNASSAGHIELRSVSGKTCNINTSSAGVVAFKAITAETADIDASSSGRIEVSSGTVSDVSLEASSGGNIKLTNVKATTCNANASSSGFISIEVSDKLKAKASSGGEIKYKGDCKVDVDVSSGGKVNKG